MTMRPESDIVELREIASGVAIAASVSEISDYLALVVVISLFKLLLNSEISDSSCHSDLRSVRASQRPPARVTCSITLLGAKRHGLRGLAQPGRRRSSVLKSC